MYREEIVLENTTGLYARPASIFVEKSSRYISDIKFVKNERRYNAKSIMGVLSMGALRGDVLSIEAKGEDAKEAVAVLAELLKEIGD